MKSTKPYLLEAMYSWIVDSGLTPHLVADANHEGIQAPPQAAEDGRIVLNCAPEAVRDLVMDDEGASFIARFGGVSQAVWLPIDSIEGIYARENGRGMVFGPEELDEEGGQETTSEQHDGPDKSKKQPSLRVVK